LLKADLHVHTRFSQDSSISPKTLVELLSAHPSIKAVAVTDHNTVDGCRRTRELAAAYSDILIIPGVEITTPLGDLIVLGVEALPPRPWSVENVLEFAKANGGVTVVAHPFREYGMGYLARNYSVDAIEVLNGCAPANVNRLAEGLAREMNLPGVAGSDAHNVDELWTVCTEIEAPPSTERVLDALRKGLVSVSSLSRSIRF